MGLRSTCLIVELSHRIKPPMLKLDCFVLLFFFLLEIVWDFLFNFLVRQSLIEKVEHVVLDCFLLDVLLNILVERLVEYAHIWHLTRLSFLLVVALRCIWLISLRKLLGIVLAKLDINKLVWFVTHTICSWSNAIKINKPFKWIVLALYLINYKLKLLVFFHLPSQLILLLLSLLFPLLLFLLQVFKDPLLRL
jgi:hypothetical protein